MNLLYPLGLLGLIGIPILIIIYIIKNKYTEQVISSTYLWTLSERFLKRRNPINKMAGILSLIFQILVVLFLSVAVAHPVFTVPNSASSYCFILDGSGSMNMTNNGQTRLDTGKKEIASIIRSTVEGSEYTLIYAGNTTNVVFENLTDKDYCLKLLNECEPSFKSTAFTYAIGTAQEYFNENPSVKTYLVTDKSYESTENVDVINVSAHEKNYAVTDVAYELSETGLKVTGKLFSYEGDAALKVRLYLDDSEQEEAEKAVWVNQLEETEFEFQSNALDFYSLRVKITNTDALALDNEVVLFNEKYENPFRAQLVSDNPFFVKAVLAARTNASVDAVTVEDYVYDEGYDLYIFDSFTPEIMPRSGAVWFINPVENHQDSGFTLQGEMPIGGLGGKLVPSTSKQPETVKLLSNLNNDEIFLLSYMKCGVSRNFTTLFSYEGSPIIFTGSNSYGNREVVFAFDFHESNFPLLGDFVTLINNLLDYTFPNLIDETSYYCGDFLNVNIVSGCKSVKIESPSGIVSYVNMGSTTAIYELTEVGIYSITAEMSDVTRTSYISSALPEEERFTSVTEQVFRLTGEPSDEKRDGTYGEIWFWFIIIAAFVLADWAVYCYEQYQLR